MTDNDAEQFTMMTAKMNLKDVLTLVAAIGAIVAAASSWGASMNRLDALDRKVDTYAQDQAKIKWVVYKLANKAGIDTSNLEK